MSYTDQVRAAKAAIEAMGARAKLSPSKRELKDIGDHNAQGGIYYDEKTIVVDCADKREELLTLCHEAGHWISYLIHGSKVSRKRGYFKSKKNRENSANHYGFKFASQSIGSSITKEEWDTWVRG